MKNNPKKIMEIIYIFILPLFFMLNCLSITKAKNIINENQILTETTIGYRVDDFSSFDNPIKIVFDYIGQALNIDTEGTIIYIIVDYITLWFIMFITWHLFYLFFDTLMHKVLLRKE